MTEPLRAKSLDDLGEVQFDIPVDRPDGRKIIVPVRALLDHEMWDIRRGVTWPKPPITDFHKVNGEALPVYDRQDKAYLDAMNEADRLLARRNLAASLCLDVEGATLDERAAMIEKKMGRWAFAFLMGVINSINVVQQEAVDNAIESFRRATLARDTGDDRGAFDTAPVVELTEG